ncbi:MAG TPA: cupin domain-containing protein [Actinomycetota bacterium]
MPKVSSATATGGGDYGIVLDRSEAVDGYAIDFITFRQDLDHTPLLKGLPDDMCQSPHWGYVLKGRLTFRFRDHEETVEAGDAFYLPPGHVPVGNEPSTEYVQFSPEEDLRLTTETIMRNFQAMQAAGATGQS